MSITVSTVTPVYSGETYLKKLVEELLELKEKWKSEVAPLTLVEAIFVDDGSIDNSSEILSNLKSEYDWVRVVTLSRNYGQHSATVAGICHSSSDWVVTLDEDLQHKPSKIEDLFRCQVENNADVVYARPLDSVHGNSWRDKSSKLVKGVLSNMTATPQIRFFNSFRLIRGSIARAAASSSSSQTYLDIAISWFTKSFAVIELDLQDDRFIDEKKSGYGLSKLIKHARHLIVSSEIDITTSGLITGGLAVLIALVISVFVVLQKIFFPELVAADGWTSLIAVVTFFGGVIIALLCIALEYINIVVLNQLGKPSFFTIDRSSDLVIDDWYKSQ